MNWEVSGVERDSGDEVTVLIEADTEESAIRRGNRRGLMVSSAVPASALPASGSHVAATVPQIVSSDELSVESADEPAVDFFIEPQVEAGPQYLPPPSALNYTSPARLASANSGRAPDYADITKGAAVLRSAATVVLIIGLIVAGLVVASGFISMIMGLASSRLHGGGMYAGIPLIIAGVLYGLGAYATYAVLRLTAACSLALRDVARNSFGRRD